MESHAGFHAFESNLGFGFYPTSKDPAVFPHQSISNPFAADHHLSLNHNGHFNQNKPIGHHRIPSFPWKTGSDNTRNASVAVSQGLSNASLSKASAIGPLLDASLVTGNMNLSAGQPLQLPRQAPHWDVTAPAYINLEEERQPSLSPTDPIGTPRDQSKKCSSQTSLVAANGKPRFHSQRRPANRDEFDGPVQLLNFPTQETIDAQDQKLPRLPISLEPKEQNDILTKLNEVLSKCAFDWVARYQFPIPKDSEKKEITQPSDREWSEWAYLLKRLATKRRVPARLLYDNQIKSFVTVIENSIDTRQPANGQRAIKDDRHILQLVSAGIQVAKILQDGSAMQHLSNLYDMTDQLLLQRKMRTWGPGFPKLGSI